MLQVRKKTADAVTPFARRIEEMSDAGIQLSWERYEGQLPLCGFTQNGLNCSACFQGPCRINPFGESPDRASCGMVGAQIVLHNLFSHVRRGTLDHLNVWLNQLPDEADRDSVLQADHTTLLADRLPDALLAGLRKRGLLPRNLFLDALTARNPFTVDAAALEPSLATILRMGVCSLLASTAIVNLSATESHHECDEDASSGVTLLVDGSLPRAFLDALHSCGAGDTLLRITGVAGNGFVHGGKTAFLAPGSQELAIASAEIDFVLQSDLDGYPALSALCDSIGVPRATILERGPWPDAAAILASAREHRKRSGASPATPDSVVVRTGGFSADAAARIHDAVAANVVNGVVLLVAGTNVRQTHFERTLKVASALLSENVVLLLAGDAAAIGIAGEELAKSAGPRVREVLQQQPYPWLSLGSVFETARAFDVLARVAGPRGFTGVPVAATFLEIPSASFLASAFGWLALGVPTQLGSPLPLWGDPGLARVMTDKSVASWGAPFLASPTLASPEEQAQQLLNQLRRATE